MDVVSSTQAWVNKVIVKYNICPFAKKEVDRGSIRYCEENSTEIEGVLERLTEECVFLDNNAVVRLCKAVSVLIYDLSALLRHFHCVPSKLLPISLHVWYVLPDSSAM